MLIEMDGHYGTSLALTGYVALSIKLCFGAERLRAKLLHCLQFTLYSSLQHPWPSVQVEPKIEVSLAQNSRHDY